jgi:hypothetical protein
VKVGRATLDSDAEQAIHHFTGFGFLGCLFHMP